MKEEFAVEMNDEFAYLYCGDSGISTETFSVIVDLIKDRGFAWWVISDRPKYFKFSKRKWPEKKDA